MLKLKLQYFDNLMQSHSLEKTLMMEMIEGQRRRRWQRVRWLDDILIWWTWVWASSGVGDRQGSLVCCNPRGHKTSDMTEQLNCPTHDFAVFPVPKLQALGSNAKELTYQCRRCKRCKFVPCVGKIPWRREWFPTPVFLPGKSHGQRSLAGYTAHVVAELNIGE